MALSSGSRVGVYEVLGLVGVGGMGEVYRARDTRLDRPAALKTLPDEFARDPERLARFEREARTLAQLNHPHIASIYGLEGGGAPALAMEMVEGPTLADRIAAGPIALDEALAIAKQIAEALEHAHGLGIVHRDLKPANVKVGDRDGAPKVKVLDFGLAKAMLTEAMSGSTPSAVSSPTITSPANMTRAGVILGTAAYMAPEQARGKQVDQRADIWAFGCVLFEMITARRAFPGDETPDVLARVIQSEPDWKLIPASTPHALVTVLHRCLRKDPARRMHSIADVRIDLDDVASGALHAVAAPSSRGAWRVALPAAALGAIAAAAAMWTLAPPPAATGPAPVMRFGLPLPGGLTLHRDPGQRPNLALSPDGETLAAVLRDRAGVPRAYLRRFDDAAFQVVAGSEDTLRVFWSPDGTRLGLTTGLAVRSVDRSGVNAQSLFTMTSLPQQPFWAANGDIVLAAAGQPAQRWSPGGQPAPIARPASGQPAPIAPFPLGDGRRVLYVEGRNQTGGAIMMRDADQSPRTVVEVESTRAPSAQYYDGYLLIAHSAGDQSVITAQRFDPASGALSGRRVTLTTNASMLFTASSSALVFAHASSTVERFVWVDERGAPLSSLEGDISIFNFDLSADGRMLVLEQRPVGLSVRDLTRGVTSSLSAEGVDPVWSRDGSQVAYAVPGKRTVHLISPFGGQSRQIYQSDAPVYLDDWSRDGRWLAGHTSSAGPGILIPVGHDGKPIPFPHDGLGVDETRFSPDGRWLAYGVTGPVSQTALIGSSGHSQVFLIDVPPTGRRWQVSVNGGVQPRWRDDGKALYFLSMTGAMMMVDVTLAAGAAPRFSAPRPLFDTQIEVLSNVDQFAVSADGSRFLLRRPVDLRTQDDPQVILNWQSLLKEGK